MAIFSKAAKHIALNVFEEASRDTHGKIIDSTESRGIVYARATGPHAREVRAKDKFFGGVAFRATDTGVSIHPFAYRVVCSNGMIVARSRMSAEFDFDRRGDWEPSLRSKLRHAFVVCASEPAFEETMTSVRSTLDHEVDMAMMIMSMADRLPADHELLMEIVTRAQMGGGRNTAYDWMNALTATARTARNPEVRWELEKLGALVPSFLSAERAKRKVREGAIA